MLTAFYTLVRMVPSVGAVAVVEPGHIGKVKSYTKPQFARSARTQTGNPDSYRILETVAYANGDIRNGWIS